MLVWLTLPFYDFCGFKSVAVNSVYKLQFFYIYCSRASRHMVHDIVTNVQMDKNVNIIIIIIINIIIYYYYYYYYYYIVAAFSVLTL